MGCDRSQALIPGDDWAWQDCTQFFYKVDDFGCSRPELTVHLTGHPRHDVVNFFFLHDLSYPRCRQLVGWNGF